MRNNDKESNVNPEHQLFLQWLEERKPFGVNYLMKEFRFGYWVAEDIFCKLRERYVEDTTRCFPMKRGVLVSRLKWAALDYLDWERAPIRGGGAAHDSVDAVEGRVIGWPGWGLNNATSTGARNKLVLNELLLLTIKSKCKGNVELVRVLMLRALRFSDADFDHISDLFTRDEAEVFMGRKDFCSNTLRRKVNRIRKNVDALMEEKLARSGDSEWLN